MPALTEVASRRANQGDNPEKLITKTASAGTGSSAGGAASLRAPLFITCKGTGVTYNVDFIRAVSCGGAVVRVYRPPTDAAGPSATLWSTIAQSAAAAGWVPAGLATVQIMSCHPGWTEEWAWTFAAPAEACTDRLLVDSTLAHYKTSLVFAVLDSLRHVTPAGQRTGNGGASTPAAPQKPLPRTTADSVAGGLLEPRSLVPELTASAVARSPPPPWRRLSLYNHLRGWHVRWEYFQSATNGLSPYDLLGFIEEELRGHTAAPAAGWPADWMLSLLECQCEALIETAAYTATAAADATCATTAVVDSCHEALRHCVRVGHCIRGSVDYVLRASCEAERRDSVSGFPSSVVNVLMRMLRLRALRHQALASYNLDDAPSHLVLLPHQVLEAALEDAHEVARIVQHLCDESEWAAPLAPSILLFTISAVELTRYTQLTGPSRCQLLETAGALLEAWQRIVGLPRRVAPYIEDTLQELVAAGVDSAVATRKVIYARFTEVGAAEPRPRPSASLPYAVVPILGYTMRRVWSMAAADQLFSHGYRQVRRLTALHQAPAP